MNKRKENLTGWLFVTPVMIVFFAFIAFPFLASILISFADWDFFSGWENFKWVGLKNYIKLTTDKNFKQAMVNTVVYVIATVPTSIVISVILAYVLNGDIHFKKLLRLAFFIPYISSTVALAAVFKFLFRDDGMINGILRSVFNVANPPKWLANPSLTRIPIILLVIWTAIGYQLIVYMAALQNVPKELYESANLDGANKFQQFMKITLPMISPTTFYLIIVRLIAVFKIFSSVNIMTMGVTNKANTSVVLEVYTNAFSKYKFGYASAEAMVLFVMILAVTVFQFWAQKKWVHY
jgi:multiple sugar transport system permease protein